MMLDRAFGYYLDYIEGEIYSEDIDADVRSSLFTFSLAEFPGSDLGNGICKLKGSPETLNKIVEWSKTCDAEWIVDFNQSLTVGQLCRFTDECRLDRCLFIEQPVLMTRDFDMSELPVSIWADEEVKHLSPLEFSQTGYEGFMLKILNHESQALKKWIETARTNGIPFYVSGVVCDTLHYKQMEYFDRKSRYQNCLAQSPGFLRDEMVLDGNPYLDRSFSQCIDEIKDKYQFMYSVTIDRPQERKGSTVEVES